MFPPITFHDPSALWLILAVPVLAYWTRRTARRRPALRYPLTGRVVALGPLGARATWLKAIPISRSIVIVLLAIAISRPQSRQPSVRDPSVEGIDIVIALDLSTSMEAGDFRPRNRITVAKDVLTEFISSRVNDRIGLVVFAGVAYTQAPLTLDYGILKEVVKQLRTRVLEDGTAIGDAIAVALNRLRESDAKSRVIVLITDGDNNAGKVSPLDAAQMAKSLGIPVFTILVGKGGKVPFPAGVDLFGNPAWRETDIPVNPALLQEISARTGGEYYRAVDRESLRAGLQKVLDAMERSKLIDSVAGASLDERFAPFLLAAFLLVLLELWLSSTWWRVLP